MKRTHHRSKKPLILLFGILVITVGAALWFWPGTSEAPVPEPVSSEPQEPENVEEPEPQPESINLQPTVDTWVNGQGGNYGIVVYDPASKSIIASHQTDEKYFTASIYKLYVAYVSLIDFQTGAQNPDEVILAGQTRKECVYKMIHSSDSPCGETVLNNIGGVTLTNRLSNDFGFTGTGFPAFQTTAGDTNKLLVRLHEGKELNEANTKFLLDAMRTQIYRTGLPAGMPNAVVADKVGFDSPDLWMDTGIITLPDNSDYIVTIYGNGGVGSAQISDFGRTIYAKLTEN